MQELRAAYETPLPSVLLADPQLILQENSLESVRNELRSFLYGDFGSIFAEHDHSELFQMFKTLQLVAQYFMLESEVTSNDQQVLLRENQELAFQIAELKETAEQPRAEADPLPEWLVRETVYKRHILNQQLYIQQLQAELKKQQSTEPNECIECGKKFDSLEHLQMHYQRRHSSENAKKDAEQRVEQQYKQYVQLARRKTTMPPEAFKAFGYPERVLSMHVQSDLHSANSSFTDVLESYSQFEKRVM